MSAPGVVSPARTRGDIGEEDQQLAYHSELGRFSHLAALMTPSACE